MQSKCGVHIDVDLDFGYVPPDQKIEKKAIPFSISNFGVMEVVLERVEIEHPGIFKVGVYFFVLF